MWFGAETKTLVVLSSEIRSRGNCADINEVQICPFFLYFSSPLPPLAKKIRPLLEKAIRTWENRTCITFKEIPLEDEDDLHGYSDSQKRHRGPFLVFVRSSGCWSYVGRQYWRRWGQRLSIGRGCTKVGGWCLWVEET